MLRDWPEGYQGRGVYAGIDIGQKRDPTAIAIVEMGTVAVGGEVELTAPYGGPRSDRWLAMEAEFGSGAEGSVYDRVPSHAGRGRIRVPATVNVYVVRHLERLPLGTPYPDVAARVVDVLDGAKARGADVRRVYVDATGVGQPVVDMLARAGANGHGQLVPVYFTHGDRRSVGDKSPWPVSLGKAWLVSRLQVLLQEKRLMFPATTPEREALTRELLDYEIRVSEDANDRYGAFRVGAHDDLVTAIGLACQDERRYVSGPLMA